MQVRKKSFFSGIIYLLITYCICLKLHVSELDALVGLRYLGYICLFELLAFFVLHKYSSGYLFEYSVIFVFVLFVFNFGQLMIYTYFRNIYHHVRFLLLMSKDHAYYGFTLMNFAFITICGAILIGESKVTNKKYTTNVLNEVDMKTIVKILIAITFPVKVILDLVTLYISLTVSGPAARLWVNTFPNIILYYGKISLLGFALIIILNRDNYKKQRNIFLFMIGYILVMMISGIRSENVGYLLVFVFLFLFTSEKKVNVLSILFLLVAGIVGLAFISAAGDFRVTTDKSFSTFFECVSKYLLENNVLLSLLDTLGDTGYTGQSVINGWLPINKPFMGKSYIFGLFSLIPNIPYFFTFPGYITEKTCFALILQKSGVLSEYYQNIGGSLIGELFFNFGTIGGIFFAFVLGIIYGNISKKCTTALNTSNYEKLIWLIPFMFFGTYWVRDYFGGGFREVVWGPLLLLMIRNLYYRRDK